LDSFQGDGERSGLNNTDAASSTTNGVTFFTYKLPGSILGVNSMARLHFCETFFTTAGLLMSKVTIDGTQGGASPGSSISRRLGMQTGIA